MKHRLLLLLYQIALPVFLLVAMPGFLIKMRRRGGWKKSIWERFGRYSNKLNSTDILIQAVSVGEGLIAMKLIESLRRENPDCRITLAVGTATGRQMAELRAPSGVQVIYAPLDLPWMTRKCLAVVDPKVIAFVEGECWPNFTRQASTRGIPMLLVSARLSPTSASRYERFPTLAKLLFGNLKFIGVPGDDALEWWSKMSLQSVRIEKTGNVKFDPTEDARPRRRELFDKILQPLLDGKRVLLAVSTHAGEEELIVEAARGLDFLPVIVPRHAERADKIQAQLEGIGWKVIRRSCVEDSFQESGQARCLLVDTTGELRDWTAHADAAVVGKSWLTKGGQSPVEAILAKVPVIVGPDMSNFKALVADLKAVGGIRQVAESDPMLLRSELQRILDNPEKIKSQTEAALADLSRHEGATLRSAERVLASLSSVKAD